MALDLNEEKDLNDKISGFFSKNKKNIILYSLIFLVFYFAFILYINHEEKKFLLASNLYQKVQLTNEINDVESFTNELKMNYADTAYASRASIYLGNFYFKNKDYLRSKENFEWATVNSPEISIQSLAYYQLGTLLFVQEKYDEAIIVSQKINELGYVGLKNNLIGDIYKSQKNYTDALKHYNIAFEFYKDKNDLAKVLKTKIDAIGQN